jgi:ribosomal protein L37AE/L43A
MKNAEICEGCDSPDIEFVEDAVYYCSDCGTYFDSQVYLDAEFERKTHKIKKRGSYEDD